MTGQEEFFHQSRQLKKRLKDLLRRYQASTELPGWKTRKRKISSPGDKTANRLFLRINTKNFMKMRLRHISFYPMTGRLPRRTGLQLLSWGKNGIVFKEERFPNSLLQGGKDMLQVFWTKRFRRKKNSSIS